MRIKCWVVLLLAAELSLAAPWGDDSDAKVREKRKEVPLEEQLQQSGLAKKRAVEEQPEDRLQPVEKVNAAEVSGGTRVKKAPNGPCGRTACGPLLSAQGPGVKDLDMQRSMELAEQLARSSPDMYLQPQARTYDLGYTPVVGYGGGAGSGSSGYGTISAPSYGHSIFSQPQPVHVETVPYVPYRPLGGGLSKHPLFNHQLDLSYNAQRLQDYYVPAGYSEIRRPMFIADRTYIDQDHELSRAPLICQAYKGNLPDTPAADKSVNGSGAARADTTYNRNAEEERMREHVARVSDIKEEIMRLNEAAQKIVDQQERIAQMQASHMGEQERAASPSSRQFGMYPMGGMGSMGGGMSSSQAGASAMTAHRGGMYSQQMPFPYMRSSNAGNFPQSTEDVNLFMNMMKTFKDMSDMQQQMNKPQQTQSKPEETISDLFNGQPATPPPQLPPKPSSS